MFAMQLRAFGCKTRIKTVRFDQNGKIKGSYGVKSVQRLSTGKYKITWSVPFLTTK